MTADWRSRAGCQDQDPELFFPSPGQTPQADEAKAVCHRCPVITQCLSWALGTRQPAGVWGGLTEDERRGLLRRRGVRLASTEPAKPAKPRPARCGTEAGYQRHRSTRTRRCEACLAAHAKHERERRHQTADAS